MAQIKLLIADDHAAFRESLRDMLRWEEDIKVVSEVADGYEVLKEAGETQPDIILMDVAMPRMGGIEATVALKARWPAIRVVLITGIEVLSQVPRAVQAGADGYLPKTASPSLLLAALRAVSEGAVVFEGELWRQLLMALPPWGPHSAQRPEP